MSANTRAGMSKRSLKKIIFSQSFVSIAAVFLLFIFGEIIFPGFLSFSHIMAILRMSVFLGIVALGQTLVVISGGEGIDLSVGSVLSLGVVISAYILRGGNIST